MSLLSIVTFKKNFKETFTKEVVSELGSVIKVLIKEQITKNIPGQEKMDLVVGQTIVWIRTYLNSKNKLVQWIIDNILIPSIRAIAQNIYENLKEVVEKI